MTGIDTAGDPPCMGHLIVAGHAIDPQTWADVKVFRKAQRARLYGLRAALTTAQRAEAIETISAQLTACLGDISGKTIGGYWPIKGEVNLRRWMEECVARGATVGLPVVTEKQHPVSFYRWTPSHKMTRGFWDIPVPAVPEVLTPDIVIVPLVGGDTRGFRLGNGGGYYDRTLALLPNARRIGVGHSFAAIETIFPMPWDIAMHGIVLGDGTQLEF
ncbi:5-formyltetrahydrofolate cyclo-ligase [Pseudorhodobacter ferrugineus]|uniref:5-formyltetrahydrofolate cyclo-ligase n=1 Tax=Pseudorhodobacter ferrugineus TaxID=77008 RepID=UPI0003B4F1FC|nr:5-formyltetrahydrofolate cyclo-ligase [Pseudorhodobacter ferrugineus]